MLETLLVVLAGGIVLCLPGIAWWAWFPENNRDILEKLAEICGLSIAFTAIAALGLFLVGGHLAGIGVVMVYVLLALVAMIGLIGRSVRSGKTFKSANLTPTRMEDNSTLDEEGCQDADQDHFILQGSIEHTGNPEEDQPNTGRGWIIRNVVLLIFFAVLLGWRFYQVGELVLPAWVDPLHHTLIVRLILENGGLPDSLQPYMEVPFSYHYAFHAVTAAFALLARLPAERAVLIFGQVLNALVAVSVYRLGTSLWNDWRRAGLAALLTGFVFQMPAYYATWGRYTLLTGLVLLPLAMAIALDIAFRNRALPTLVKLALLTAGVLLSHYYAALLLAIFLIFLGIQVLISDLRQGKPFFKSRWVPLVAAVMGGVVFAGAWILRMYPLNQDFAGITTVSPTQPLDSVFFPDYIPYLLRMLGPYRNYVLLALSLLGLIIILWRTKTRAFGLWVLMLMLFSIPWGFHLSPFRPDHAVIVLFLPGSLLFADFIGTAWERLQIGRFRVVGKVLVGAVVLSLLVWGMWETRSIINPTTVFATQADLEAIEWLDVNTSPQARFMTNVVHWQYQTHRGVDGGWWIMPLTGRTTLLPPVLYVMGARDYVDQINTWAAATSQLKECSAEFWDLVQDSEVTYIYLVEGRGSLQPEGLQGCEGISEVYENGGVHIYELGGS
jgi:hypothetical protein